MSRTTPPGPASPPVAAGAPEREPADTEPARLSSQLGLFAFDIGAPIALYYLLHGAGVSNLVALSAGAALPALAAIYKLLAKHRLDGVALLVAATMVISICVSVIVHSPRFLLAKEGLITGLWGIWFIASAGMRRPAAFVFARPFMEGRKVFATRSWDSLWDTDATFRRIWRTSSLIWGTGMLADAAIRVVMSYSLPINVVPGLGGALWPVTFVLIQLVTNVYYHRAGLYRILQARWLRRAGRP
jgi:hypothetical protein